MQNKDLEQGLRDRIYNHEESVDTEQLWLDVQAGLPPEKKRRRLVWWWLPGLLLLGGLGWFVFSVVEKDSALPQDADMVEVPSLDRQASAPEAVNAGGVSLAEAPADISESSFLKSYQDESAPPRSSPAQRRKPLPSVTASTPPPPAPATAPEKAVGASPAPSPTNTNATGIRQQAFTVSRIATLPVALLPERRYDPTTPPFSNLKDPACPVFTRRKKAQWSIGVAGIGSKPDREITALNAEENGQLLRNLKVERPLNALTGQILVGYETGSGFSLRSGVGYTRINSVAEVTLDTTITTIGTGITEVIINGPGDTTFITGVVERRIHTTGTTRYYNRLSTIDLPILLGKTFRAGKWRFGVEAGPVLNLLTSGSARYQQADGTFSSRADNEGLFRKRLTGIGWQGSLSANFQLLPKLDVGLGINAYRQPRAGFEIAGAPTSTSYTLYGVRLGMKRYF